MFRTRTSLLLSVLFSSFLIQGCLFSGNHESSGTPAPTPTPFEDQIDTQEKVEDYLNDPNTSDSDNYQKALEKFSGPQNVWSKLKSTDAKIKYLEHLLARESICEETYVSVAADPETPFVCAHFSLKLYLKYREDDVPASILNGDFNKYSLTQAERKFRFPIYDVAVFIKRDDTYHAINAVWAGGSDLEDPENWIFIEPQRGQILFRRGFNSTLVKRENQYMVLHHYLEKLNKKSNVFDDNDAYFLSFESLDKLPEDKIEKLAVFEVDDSYTLKRGVSQVTSLVKRTAEKLDKDPTGKSAEGLYKFVRKHPRFRNAVLSAIDDIRYPSSSLTKLQSSIKLSLTTEFENYFAGTDDGKDLSDVFFKAFNTNSTTFTEKFENSEYQAKYFKVLSKNENNWLALDKVRQENIKRFLKILKDSSGLPYSSKLKIELFLKNWEAI